MKPPFSLLLVHGDGSRVLRFCLPRWMVYGTLGLGAGVVAAMLGLASEYAFLRYQAGQLVVLRQHADDQRALIDSFQTRVAGIRGELMGWGALHARMWEAFGPEVGANDKTTGVGGAAPDAQTPAPGVKRPGDELDLLATSVAEEGPRLRELERVVSRTGKILDRLPLRWPLRGQVNSEFGRRRSPWSGAPEQHEGIDIGSLPGTPVKCPAAGKVVAAGSHGDYGRHVVVEHIDGVRSLYGHLQEVDVKVGQRVEKGQVIGRVGSTGRSTGPHLHYELMVDGKPVDPRGFLWEHF